MIDDENVDLQYLQCAEFEQGNRSPYVRPRNPFEQRLSANLRPGLVLKLDLETAARVMAGAALSAGPGQAVAFELDLQSGWLEVIAVGSSMPPICADVAGNLVPALCWYQRSGFQSIYVAVQQPDLFWLPALPASTGTLKQR